MISKKLRKAFLATASALTLTACGGGGSGGGVTTVTDFVTNDLSNLSGSSSIVSSYSSLLSSFQSTISSGNYSSLQAILTGPDADDIATANTLLTQLSQAEALWSATEDLISQQSDGDKYTIYNSDSYKEAYAAMIYLKNHVKPVIQKVSNGKAITTADYNIVAKEDKAQEIINTEKDTTATSYAEQKKIKKTETVAGTSTVSTVDTVGTAEASTSTGDWATVNAGGGKENRTTTTTVPNYRITTTTPCTLTRKTLLNGTTVDSACTYGTSVVSTVTLDPTVTTVTEEREGDNPVTGTTTLEATVTTVTETSDNYVITNYADGNEQTSTTNGTVTTTTANRDVVTDVDNGNNTTTRTTVRYVDTTVTTPVTTRVYFVRTYTDITKKNTRIITTTTPKTQNTYKDGTTETINGTATVVTADWVSSNISTATRTEEREVSSSVANTVSTTANSGTQVAQVTISNAYTGQDTTLGTKTANMSTVVNDHKTTEYNTNHGLNTIHAADAYAKGWTGKGAVLGIIDTYQQTNHPELNGKYKWYNDYTRYDNTVSTSGNTQVHGTHVAGIIAGKRDGTGNHGVAFDAELVGANVDYYGHGGISKSRAQQALHDFAKLKDSNGENLNIVAVNMSWNTPTLFTDHNGSTVTQLSDGTYDASEITSRMNVDDGQAKYYKIATDNDMILVNSAGNYGFNHAGDPGIWATEVDASGNLILGGKMIIVGNWDGTNVAGNKAGHVCLKIVNNACNDTNKISDFYILAPGDDIYSSTPTHLSGNGYMNMSGTSMAAPHVTGAFGVINQMWPHMKGDNLVKLVLATADKNLTGYNVNIHGQGLLDLDEATKPQGAIGIPTTGRTNGPIVGTYGTYFSTGTALPSALGDLKVMILDEYERDYYINLGSTMVVKDMRKVSDIDMMMNGNTYLPVQSMYGNFTQGGNYDLGFMNFGLYTGANGGGDFTGNIGKNFMLSNNLKFKTSVGQMNEQDNWLGNASDGVLAVGDNNVTNFGQFGIEYALGNNVISFDYSKGFTDINTTDNSLITGFNNVETESMKVAYEIHNDANNTWGFSLSTPSHITNGTMNLLVPESRTLDGTVNYANIESDMSSSTIEKDIGFFYNHTPVNDMDASFNFKAEYRQDISGVAGNDGVNLAFNYVKKLNTNCKFLWMKNPRCFEKNENGKEILKANLYHNNNEDTNATKHGLVYDLKTDKFIPIKK
jgi:hypothetical protein